ncbi:50S ribosomal protein L6 [Lacticigenium naphthae]|uniref:50S ribosomal protein L6 n=1 Tax=Lacticigenium naphthae TaxID=515351 RepID=UPI00040A80D7|nr:50S ribosomal protein L6 [Lacticigenium naphthae]
MSRIGNKVITIPEGVTVTQNGENVTVKGPNGELSRSISPLITMNVGDNELAFTRPNESKQAKTIHGTTRAVVNNMVEGVTVGFTKALELNGVGYRAQLQGQKLILNVGLSHQVEFEAEEGLTVEVPSNTRITIKGANKESVGALAANIRAVRPPEPYKGKGIRYEGEYVRRKEGKTGK